MPAGLDLGTHGLKTRRWADLLRLWDGVVLGRAGSGISGPAGRHIGIDVALFQPGEIVLRTVTGIGRRLRGSAAKIGLDRIDHRQQLSAIAPALRHLMGDDDLGFGIDGDLSVIGLHEAVLALHDPALGIGEVLLGLGVWRWGRRGSFPATFAPSLDFLLLICSRLLLKLGFGRSLGLSLQFGLGLPDLRGTPLLVGDPIRHLIAALVAAMQLVLFAIRRRGRAEPAGNLGFQFRGALRHAAIAHRLVLRCIGLDLAAIKRHMPQLHQAGLYCKTCWNSSFSAFKCRSRKSEMVRKSGASSPTILMKSTRSRHALAIRREE